MTALFKYRSWLHSIIRRGISSTKPTLYETLKVIEKSTDVFVQPAETLFVFPNRLSVFGGQIIGSAVYAAQQTLTKNYPLHSLHSYFLTAADNSSDITYTVSRLRDGKSFETRSVTAEQDSRIVFECSMNFHRREQGNMEHQLPMPNTGKSSFQMIECVSNLLFQQIYHHRKVFLRYTIIFNDFSMINVFE